MLHVARFILASGSGRSPAAAPAPVGATHLGIPRLPTHVRPGIGDA